VLTALLEYLDLLTQVAESGLVMPIGSDNKRGESRSAGLIYGLAGS